MGGLFRTGRHVDRGACDRVELLPLGPEARGSHDQVGDIRNGRIWAIGATLGRRQHFIAP